MAEISKLHGSDRVERADRAVPARTRSARRGWWARFIETPVWPILATFLVFAGWELYVRVSGILEVILPAPTTIIVYTVEHFDLLMRHTWPTLFQSVVGFLLACVGGILIAIFITQFTTIRRGFYPLVVVIALIPKISVAPLFTLWFGTGDVARVALVFFISFFPMVVSPASGLMAVDPGMLRMARSLNASRMQIFWKLRVPTALPYVIDGMKVAISLAVIGIIVAEFVTAEVGLGYLIIFSTGIFDTPLMLSAILVLSILGLVLYYAVEVFGRWAVYWQDPN